MNNFETLINFLKSKKAKPNEIKEIDEYFETIVNSPIVNIENHNSGKKFIYTYSDDIFTIEKYIRNHSNGEKEIKKSIVLKNNIQVYNGKIAYNHATWLPHLKEVYETALEEEKKPKRYY